MGVVEDLVGRSGIGGRGGVFPGARQGEVGQWVAILASSNDILAQSAVILGYSGAILAKGLPYWSCLMPLT